MRPPASRVTGWCTLIVLLLTAPTAAAQTGPSPETVTPVVWGFAAVFAALVTLVVGGLWIALAPGYTERVTDRVHHEPGMTFLWGLGLFIGVVVAALLLTITVVGIIVAFPLLIAFSIVAFLTAELGYLAVGRWLVDGRWAVLAVACATAFLVALVPLIGTLAGFVIGSMGMGAVVVEYRAG
ncbi:MAG: hypothetical protein ACOC0X_03805 [Halobacteriota archaeon]